MTRLCLKCVFDRPRNREVSRSLSRQRYTLGGANYKERLTVAFFYFFDRRSKTGSYLGEARRSDECWMPSPRLVKRWTKKVKNAVLSVRSSVTLDESKRQVAMRQDETVSLDDNTGVVNKFPIASTIRERLWGREGGWGGGERPCPTLTYMPSTL